MCLSQLLNFADESLKLPLHERSSKLAICHFKTSVPIANLSLNFPCAYQRLRSYGPRLSCLWGESCVGVFDCSTTAVNLKKSIFSGLHSLQGIFPPLHNLTVIGCFNSFWISLFLNVFPPFLLHAQYGLCTLNNLLVCLDAFHALCFL